MKWEKESGNLTEDIHYQELGSKGEHLGEGGHDVPTSWRRLLSSNHLEKAAGARQDLIYGGHECNKAHLDNTTWPMTPTGAYTSHTQA